MAQPNGDVSNNRFCQSVRGVEHNRMPLSKIQVAVRQSTTHAEQSVFVNERRQRRQAGVAWNRLPFLQVANFFMKRRQLGDFQDRGSSFVEFGCVDPRRFLAALCDFASCLRDVRHHMVHHRYHLILIKFTLKVELKVLN